MHTRLLTRQTNQEGSNRAGEMTVRHVSQRLDLGASGARLSWCPAPQCLP